MNHSWAVAVYLGCLALAAVGVVAGLLGRPVGRLMLAAAAAVEGVVIVMIALVVARIAGGARPPELGTVIAYLVGVLLIVPIGVVWSLAERTRWSSVVIAVASLTVAVMTARLEMLWRGTVG